jgi:acetoin:2,6-dichlorophenolindophenol oxidoreductase subunit alpha
VTEQPATVAESKASSADEAEHYLELYRRMRLIRRFEDEVQSLFQKGLVHGTTHLCSGQEAGPVGVASVLADEDRVAGTYRGHGHALALGVDPTALLAELLGRATGVCGGRAGSMNVIDLEHRLVGCYGIVGGSIAAATGVALALKRTSGVAVAFFGDGATNQGYFHECLNFAKVFALPVVYMCENNRYGEFTPFEQVTAGDIAARPQALGLATSTIDGNDIWTVRETAGDAVQRARGGEGPQFIESLTYRYVGHSRSDPGKYRKPGELDEWKARDPLTVARRGLSDRYGTSAKTLDGIDEAVEAELRATVEAATDAPFPDPAEPVAEFKHSGAPPPPTLSPGAEPPGGGTPWA